jgi:hypothetical protein
MCHGRCSGRMFSRCADALAAAEFPFSRCRVKNWIFNQAIAMKLVAIDFETADRSADSACAIGMVSIDKNKITKKGYRLIRPPRRHFVFSFMRSTFMVARGVPSGLSHRVTGRITSALPSTAFVPAPRASQQLEIPWHRSRLARVYPSPSDGGTSDRFRDVWMRPLVSNL